MESRTKVLSLQKYNRQRMNKIHIISPPDKMYNDAYTILVMYPGAYLQKELQSKLLELDDVSVNVYVYNELTFQHENFVWLLDVFNRADLTIIDIDNIPLGCHTQKILSYMIAKPKTYWLTNHEQLVYNYISNNRIYDLSFLSTVGVFNDKKQ